MYKLFFRHKKLFRFFKRKKRPLNRKINVLFRRLSLTNRTKNSLLERRKFTYRLFHPYAKSRLIRFLKFNHNQIFLKNYNNFIIKHDFYNYKNKIAHLPKKK